MNTLEFFKTPKFKKNACAVIMLLLLFAVTYLLRFTNLGYSEMIPDEKKTRIILGKDETVSDYLFRQRKGPMQFLVSHVSYMITGDYTNEFALRLPFSVFSLLSVFVLYYLIFLITGKHAAAFIVSLIYSINGFLVGFGRISQYQSLNVFFSLSSLLFFYLFSIRKNKLWLFVTLSAAATAFSMLSHWDAVYYFPLALYFVIVFILRKDIEVKRKIALLSLGLVVFLAISLPFLIPYVKHTVEFRKENIEYIGGRFGIGGSSFAEHLFIFRLYNPFVTEYFYLAGFILSILFFKKTRVFVLWFLLEFFIIKYLVSVPKTHIYNYLIPLNISIGLGFYYFLEFLYKKTKWLFAVFLLASIVSISFLTYQSYILMVDHEPEYPWYVKKVLWFETKPFYFNQVITFGFPHHRGWKEVDKIIPPDCKFITNENKSIPQTYLRAKHGKSDTCSYVVVIKEPFNLDGADAKYAGLKKSKRVFQYRNSVQAVTSVYRIN